ncbi:MAG: hypothetical protein ACI9TB_001861, partial [Parasphingorhabdus sp.]
VAPLRRGGHHPFFVAALPRFAPKHCHQTEQSEASATARPSLCEESQGRGCARPALEV